MATLNVVRPFTLQLDPPVLREEIDRVTSIVRRLSEIPRESAGRDGLNVADVEWLPEDPVVPLPEEFADLGPAIGAPRGSVAAGNARTGSTASE